MRQHGAAYEAGAVGKACAARRKTRKHIHRLASQAATRVLCTYGESLEKWPPIQAQGVWGRPLGRFKDPERREICNKNAAQESIGSALQGRHYGTRRRKGCALRQDALRCAQAGRMFATIAPMMTRADQPRRPLPCRIHINTPVHAGRSQRLRRGQACAYSRVCLHLLVVVKG